MYNVGAFLQFAEPPSLLGRPVALLGRARTFAPGLASRWTMPSWATPGPRLFFLFCVLLISIIADICYFYN
jgi:hypothetical protein